MPTVKLQDKKECFVCHTRSNLHHHEVFYGTANRSKSIKYHCQVWLCAPHHNMSLVGVHYNHELDMKLKRYAQTEFEKIYGHEKFMEVFHKNYLDE